MRFSIIIPVYNVASWLQACLESVLSSFVFANHKYKVSVEVICIDDGSTDGSGDLLESFAKRTEGVQLTGFEFKVVRQKNQGVSLTRNQALGMVSGDWVLFLDGDDVYVKETFRVLFEQIDRHSEVDLVNFGVGIFQDGETWSPGDSEKSGLVDLTKTIHDINSYRFVSFAYKRNLIKGMTFPAYRNGEDIVFLANVLSRANGAVTTSKQLYGYRQRTTSASHSVSTVERIRDLIVAYMDVLRIWNTCGKNIQSSIVRGMENALMEAFWVDWLKLTLLDRKEAWGIWKRSLDEFSRMKIVGGFNRIRAVCCRIFPWVGFAFIVGYIPYWMKRKGLHRRGVT